MWMLPPARLLLNVMRCCRGRDTFVLLSDDLRVAVQQALAVRLPDGNATLVEAQRLLVKLEAAGAQLQRELQSEEDEMDRCARA